MRHCTKSFLGFPFRHEVVLAEERERGELTAEWVVTTRRSLTYAVGPDLKPVEDVFELDTVLWLAYLAYVVAAQGLYGATLGKRLLRLRVVDRYGVRPGLGAAAIRNLVLNGPLLAGLAALLADGLDLVREPEPAPRARRRAGARAASPSRPRSGWTARQGKPSLHDRLAGTRVVSPAAERGRRRWLTGSQPRARRSRSVFGYDDFRPGQDEIVAAVLAGEDVLRRDADRQRQVDVLPAAGDRRRRR